VAGLPEAELAEALRTLVTAEFIHEQALYPEAEYAFRHPLTQEVTYDSQLAEPRTHVHRAVAQAIEERFPESLDEHAALIASHWDRGGESKQAAAWHFRAAMWLRLNNAPESLRHARRIQELLADVPESPETIALALRARGLVLFEHARLGVDQEELPRLLEEGRELSRRCSDPDPVAMFCSMAATSMWVLGRLGESHALALEARALADRANMGMASLYARVPDAITSRTMGRLNEALTAADEAIELARAVSRTPTLEISPLPFLLMAKGWALTQIGRLADAARALEEGIEHAVENGDWAGENICYDASVELARTRGDAEAALAHSQIAVERSEQTGTLFAHCLAFLALGKAHVAAGRWQEALEALGEVLSIPRERGTVLWAEPEILGQMAAAQLGLGNGSEARELAEQAVALARERLNKPAECEAEIIRARVLLHLDGPGIRDEIVSALDAASVLAAEMNAKSFDPFIEEERAHLARAAGESDACHRHLREAHRLFAGIGATGHAARLARELNLEA
jgi:tetratricopeptide (TPR) repeat protein